MPGSQGQALLEALLCEVRTAESLELLARSAIGFSTLGRHDTTISRFLVI